MRHRSKISNFLRYYLYINSRWIKNIELQVMFVGHPLGGGMTVL